MQFLRVDLKITSRSEDSKNVCMFSYKGKKNLQFKIKIIKNKDNNKKL